MTPADGLVESLLDLSDDEEAAALEGLSGRQHADALWDLTAHAGQRPDRPDWATWVFLGGRGAGKTRAGAEWLAGRAARQPGRYALVGPSLHDVREVMIEGPSGLRSLPGRRRPTYEPSRRRLTFANGAVAFVFSAEDPDSLRGPQFMGAWADEFCVWRDGGSTLALLRMGLRLGTHPRLVVTTTPRPIASLRQLLQEPGCVRTDAASAANARHLSPGFLTHLKALYGGTRLEAQELEGRLLEAEGALFRADDLARSRGEAPGRLERTVVAVDPPASEHGDACGIVVAGRAGATAYVLADRTAPGLTPGGWGARVAEAARTHGAQAVIAEANQGGDMVGHVLETAGCPCPVKLVRASRSKAARAEPVAALYEQGRVVHCGDFRALEEELMALGPGRSDRRRSPDRADALVWAITDLLVEPRAALPRVRGT